MLVVVLVWTYFVTVIPRCGSVIVDLALKFSSTVRESEVLYIFRDAVKNGEFGDFNISVITGTQYDTETTTTMTRATPSSSSDSSDSKLP